MTEKKELQPGDSFETHSTPMVDEMVVLQTDSLSGYTAAYVAERNVLTGEWDAHWLKASYIHDEVNLGATTPTGTVGEDRLQSLARRLRPAEPDTASSPERVEPVASLD